MIINDIGYYIYIYNCPNHPIIINRLVHRQYDTRENSTGNFCCNHRLWCPFPLKNPIPGHKEFSLEDWPSIHCLKHSKITCFTRCTKDLKIRTSGVKRISVYFQIRHHLINLINLITLKNLASPKILRVKDWVPLQSDG